ncbi:unnamed protein product [Pleuronectes platessa]|uniref:Uncharacterized protein n=1 Tax=Pleuronectes platessa TaxID=8262 RepID=A0A9N7TWY6_PLEPL|nr:unnamed protein product [Pleuronectes platessa]
METLLSSAPPTPHSQRLRGGHRSDDLGSKHRGKRRAHLVPLEAKVPALPSLDDKPEEQAVEETPGKFVFFYFLSLVNDGYLCVRSLDCAAGRAQRSRCGQKTLEQGRVRVPGDKEVEAAPFILCDCGGCRGRPRGFAEEQEEDAGSCVCMGERGPGAALNGPNKRHRNLSIQLG